ncbi:methylglutaconyl-CoA hydratase, mitochondrial isoform X2 [Hydra vulgaris]|uniref:Methylglutaconyl-CoA hydratase, mitochondrial isoform X2 n=1 Tax=Hydra vulgaris TaxID=6087 RepID=A0ABM4CID3_HYDVU
MLKMAFSSFLLKNVSRTIGLSRQQVLLYSTSIDVADELHLDFLDNQHKGVAVISINRPESKNSLGKNLLKLFDNAINVVSNNSSLRAIILRSIVPGVFCAGADLKERQAMSEADVPKFVSKARMLFQRFSEIPVPTIVSIEGAALGGGLELALACDLRVASSTAKLGLPETKLAIIPGAGGTVRLPRIIGTPLAKELIFTGRVLKALDAEKIGLINYAVEQNHYGNAAYLKALELAEEILTSGPVALRCAKMSLNRSTEVDIYSGLAFEEFCYAQIVPTKDRVEGLTAFKEKRKPIYRGE